MRRSGGVRIPLAPRKVERSNLAPPLDRGARFFRCVTWGGWRRGSSRWLDWFEGGLVLVIDGDAVEQCPVEHPPLGWFGPRVDVADVGEESEDRVEPDLGLVVGRLQRVEPAGDRLQARSDAVLLGLEQVERDRVGVVGLEELDLIGFELGLLPARSFCSSLVDSARVSNTCPSTPLICAASSLLTDRGGR